LALHDAEADADEVVGVPDDNSEAGIRELEASTRRRAGRGAVDGIVPEGHRRSPVKTYQDTVFNLRTTSCHGTESPRIRQ